jgi:hypothetical protein
VTAPDPRLGEIEARMAAQPKAADCAKCRIATEDCWCPECEYWGCEQGPDCEDDPKPTDVAFLLTELRKRDEVIARVEALHQPLEVYEYDHINGYWVLDSDGEKIIMATLCQTCTPATITDSIGDCEYAEGENGEVHWPCDTSAAVTAAKGDGEKPFTGFPPTPLRKNKVG